MLDNGYKYGMLSTYNSTRFLSARDRDHVEISEVVMADAKDVTLRRAFAYWLVLCTGPGGLLEYGTVERGTKKRARREFLEEEKCTTENAPTVIGFPSSSSTHLPQSDTVLQSSGIANELHQFIHDHFVDWSELEIQECLGDLKLALKLFGVGKHGIEAFEREIRAYAYALLNSSKVSQGVRTRFALGHDLPDLESWSQEQREDALEALRSVLGVGLIQNDVRDCNFVHIDFEDSSIILDSSSSR